MSEWAVCQGLALIQEESGNQTQHKARGELGQQMHQNQETEKPGDHTCAAERESKGDGGSREAFPSWEAGGPGAGDM